MGDWNNDRRGPEGSRDAGWRGGRDWRDASDRNPRDREAGNRSAYPGERDRYADDRGRSSGRGNRGGEQPPGYQSGRTFEPGGSPGEGYGEGGDTPFGQMASGSSGSGLGGYSSADVGGWGQPVQNSQSGQGGFAPLNQGLDYGQDGGRFGPRGYSEGEFGPTRGSNEPHDEHHHNFRRWRDTQLASHDRDYSRWRDQQSRRYDEDYGAWRNERHDAFSREFEGWRAGRGGQSAPATSGSTGAVSSDPTVRPSEAATTGQGDPNAFHGANPTLARIAEGHEGRVHHDRDERKAEDKTDASRS